MLMHALRRYLHPSPLAVGRKKHRKHAYQNTLLPGVRVPENAPSSEHAPPRECLHMLAVEVRATHLAKFSLRVQVTGMLEKPNAAEQ